MDRDNAFTPEDALNVTREYVCAVCSHDLEIIEVPSKFLRLVVCPIHGDITVVGRVTRATVSINHERESVQFHSAIANLADLFPDLQSEGMSREIALKIQHTDVCAVCGGLLQVSATDTTFAAYQAQCRKHKSAGHIQRAKYIYDFQAMRTWEREHKKETSHANP